LKQLKDSNTIESFVKEGVTWLGLRHPNIVRFYGIYKGFFFNSKKIWFFQI